MRISFYFIQTISGHSYKILLGYIGDLGLIVAHYFLPLNNIKDWGVYKMLYCWFFVYILTYTVQPPTTSLVFLELEGDWNGSDFT